uniref:Uncharacterized protein n=1 Tax=Gouania willdenowi TaxID=441366 RepID=A0A8C5EGV1_GOUWI
FILSTKCAVYNILIVRQYMTVFCFVPSASVPFMYRGLLCIYSSAMLASGSLLSGGNMNFYPHDRVLESQAWKKVVYAGDMVMLFLSSFPPACVYYLLWSISYILFPTSLWSSKV